MWWAGRRRVAGTAGRCWWEVREVRDAGDGRRETGDEVITGIAKRVVAIPYQRYVGGGGEAEGGVRAQQTDGVQGAMDSSEEGQLPAMALSSV